MTNEEFQRVVLEKLGNIETKVDGLETKVDRLEVKVDDLEKGQQEMKEDIRAIIEQTAELSEFRYEANTKLDRLTDEFNTMEIITSKNWTDIAKLKAAR